MKGNRGVPNQKVMKSFARMVPVIPIWEYNTSRQCYSCLCQETTQTVEGHGGDHSYTIRRCPGLHKAFPFNRDINAALNIASVLKARIAHPDVHQRPIGLRPPPRQGQQ
eukprot:TRINITY_DN2049_c0_g1_i4.p2 TRINITY_DN2049_c0_g1~~TRINITY_DN2049_c0_g1_i4.p2  ORF type:complete len:109 (-),score=5.67 TRINITY_DN2049_c0_g1_i4:11-337(-)